MSGLKKMVQDRGGPMEGISSYHVQMIMTWSVDTRDSSHASYFVTELDTGRS